MLATRMRQAAAGVVGLSPATIAFSDAAGDSAPGTSPSISLDCGVGGEFICFLTANNAGGTVSGWTLDGQTITEKGYVLDATSETIGVVGTCSGVTSGTNTMAATFSASQFRAMGWIFLVENVDLVTAAQQVENNSDHALSWAALTAGSVMAQIAASGSSSVYTGATNMTWTENLLVESSSSGAFALSGDSSTSTDITGGAVSHSIGIGIELNNA